MPSHFCITCKKTFKSNALFQEHSCVTKAMVLPRKEFLKRLLKSGGCSQKYYEAEIAKL